MELKTKPAPEGASSWVNFCRVLAMHRTGYAAKLDEMDTMMAPDIILNALAKTLFMVPLPVGHHMKPSALAAEWSGGHEDE